MAQSPDRALWSGITPREPTLRVGCDMQASVGGVVDALSDPVGDVAGAESEMAADPEPGRAVTVVTPGVDRGDGHAEVVGEVLDIEEAVKAVHPRHCAWQPCHHDARNPVAHPVIHLTTTSVLGGRRRFRMII